MSSNETREKAVAKYFIRTPQKPDYKDTTTTSIVAVGSGIATLIGFVGFGDGLWWLFFLGGFIAWTSIASWIEMEKSNKTDREYYESAYKRAEPKPSDQQMDTWHQADLKRIRNQVLSKLDLLPDQILGDPNIVVGPSEGTSAALGKDNTVRFSSYDIVIVYLTDYHLAAYSCTVDMHTGLETKESTQEYHYQDVVSVATQTDNSRMFKLIVDGQDKPLANYQKFSLSVASGERIEVVISLPQLDDIIKNARLAPTGAENAVKVIRAMLREKKGGA